MEKTFEKDYVSPEHQDRFMAAFKPVQLAMHNISTDKGFWDGEANPENTSNGNKIALMHSELGEMTEGFRMGNPPSDKLHEFGISNCEEELADLIIRAMDFASKQGWNLGRTILKKAAYNVGRPHRHGKNF